MVNYQRTDLDAVFHALASVTRRDIIRQVAERELSVNDIAAQHHMSLPAVSKHIKVLVKSGLIVQTRDGRIRRCRFNYEPLRAVSNLIEEYRMFWENRFDALEVYLAKTKRTKGT